MRGSLVRLFAPPVFADGAKTRLAQIIHTISLAILFVVVVIGLLTPFLFDTPENGLTTTSVVALLVLTVFLLVHRGHIRAASLIFVSMMWVFDTVLILISGGTTSAVLPGYVAVTVLAGLLLGGSAAVVFTVLSISAALGMLIAENTGIMPDPLISLTPLARWLSLIANLALAAAVLYLAMRSVRDAMKLARRKEQELTEAIDDLKREIEERRRAEEAVQESEEKYRTLAESSPVGIFIIQDGEVVYLNGAAKQMLASEDIASEVLRNWEADESFSVLSFIGILDEEQGEKLAEDLERRLAGDDIGPTEIVTPRNTHFLFISSLTVYQGAPAVLGIVQDITAVREAEEQIRLSEKRYCELYEGSRDGYAMVDMDGIIVEYNSTFREMLGYTDEELQVKTYADITPERWHEMEAAILKNQVHTRGYSDLYEKEYRRKDGTVCPVEIRTYLFKENGEPRGMWAFVRDITDRKEAEDELKAAYQRVQKALENEQLFKLKTAHHFFNPISIAKGYLSLAMEDGDVDKIKAAIAALNRIQRVVENVTQRGEIHE